MKGVMFLCLIGVHVDKKNIQLLFHLVIDNNNNFLFAHGPWKLIYINKFRSQGATILGVIN
jgi:hypothetical protein